MAQSYTPFGQPFGQQIQDPQEFARPRDELDAMLHERLNGADSSPWHNVESWQDENRNRANMLASVLLLATGLIGLVRVLMWCFCVVLIFGLLSPTLAQDRRPIVTAADNPTTSPAIALGQKLFFDPRFSIDGTVSCATCHDPQRAYTDGRPRAVGVGGQIGHRNAPTILNACYQRRLMHDGRFELLEGQAEFPVLDAGEMGLTDAELTRRLNAIPGYAALFQRAYGRAPNTIDFCRAVASFERTLVSTGEPFARYLAADVKAFRKEEYDHGLGVKIEDFAEKLALHGAMIFVGVHRGTDRGAIISRGPEYVQNYIRHNFERRTGCANCHSGRDYRDGDFHRTGVAFGKIDDGAFTIDNVEAHRKAFKTPTLKQIGETAPYMHDGSLPTLAHVVRFYNRGGNPQDGRRDRRIAAPMGLNADEEAMLVYFLQTAFLGEYPKVERPELP